MTLLESHRSEAGVVDSSLSAAHRLEQLATLARAERALLCYPDRPWTASRLAPDGTAALDVLIVGGGQSGMAIAHGLARLGVTNVAVLDRSPDGLEGPWLTFARMSELRTPKSLNGLDFGQPSLSVQRWFQARYGQAAWDDLGRISRTDWAAYLQWYRATLEIRIENETEVVDIGPAEIDGLVAVDTVVDGERVVRYASTVVLASGFDGTGTWKVPAIITDALPSDRYDHSNGRIEFDRLKGARVGVIGHGASGFDNAVAALRAGARSADLLFRRPALPTINPHRHIETAGLMSNYQLLGELTRWRIARHFQEVDQPPASSGYDAAHSLPGFAMHAGASLESVTLENDVIRVETPRGVFRFDHLIAATGAVIDMAGIAALRSMTPAIALWADRFAPPDGEDDALLGSYPYLGPTYAFTPRFPGAADWVERVFAFNQLSYVSQGPHSTSISGHKWAVPRVVRGIGERLFLDSEDGIVDALRAYDEPDLILHEHR